MSKRNAALYWLVVIPRVPAEPSRHRVAVWRELRRGGAVQLASGVWAGPERKAFRAVLDRVIELAGEAGGEATVMRVRGDRDRDAAHIESLYAAAREEEWAELVADGQKLVAEIDSEIAKGKLTLAELEEEEQSIERLRRWYRTIRARDITDANGRDAADAQIEACAARLAEFERLVYEALET